MRKILLPIFLLIVILGVAVTPVAASPSFAKSVVADRMDVDVTVLPNGDINVVQVQQIKFQGGPFREGFQTIRLKNSDGVTNVSLAEVGGRTYQSGSSGDYTFSATRNGDEIEVVWRFPSITNQTRKFQFSYTVKGVVRQYDAGDKVQFMAIPDALEYPVYASTIKIYLPSPLVADPDFAGPAAKWQISPDEKTVTIDLQSSVSPNQGFQFGIIFKHGAITAPKPTWQTEFDRQYEFETKVKPWIDLGLGALGLAMLLAVPAMLYVGWFMFGRDPNVERADLRDLTATMIDLARRGFLIMEEREVKSSFGSATKRFILKKKNALSDARRYETELYNALFLRGDEVDLSKLPEGFFTRLPMIEAALYGEAVKEKLFSVSPDQVRGGYTTVGVMLVVFSFVVGVVAFGILDAVSLSLLCPVIPIGVFGVGLAIMGQSMPRKTRAGAEEAAKWKAFQKYLSNIQKYKDVKEATDQFEKYLPYAIAFGLERRWINAFAAEPTVPPPIWYRPIYYGRPMGLGAPISGGVTAPQMPNLNQMGDGMVGGLNQIGDGMINALNTAGRSFATPPAPKYSGGGSSGSFRGGGFRGGGFSGGGFSGGGRGGFR
ncbi:MAG: DUF2207 domain-containing protein [Chloroflexi bacterium]|nr:DUF2207 domain-containing protein [Chloroflexota bacterium]